VVVRSALGERHPHPVPLVLGIIGLALGASALTMGVTLAAAGKPGTTLQHAGFVALGVGAAFTGTGIAGLVLGREEIRPGATSTWTMP
jgi:hypothetical protein